MDSWKKAYGLALLELRESKRGFILSFVFYFFIAIYVISSFPSYLEKNFLGVDSLLIIAFTIAPLWARPKPFQVRKLNSGNVAPSVVMLLQFPIQKDIIIKSRLIIHYVNSLPFQFILLASIYLFSRSVQDMMTLGTYIVFVIIWLSFSVYIGGMMPIADIGDDTPPFKMVVYTILTIIVVLYIYLMITFLSDFGIVQWTLIFAEKWPVASTILSIAFAVIGYKYWYHYMKKQLRTLDYM